MSDGDICVKLIACVRKHDILYNMDVKGYSDSFLKAKIWKEIATFCGLTSGKEAKSLWKNLRDSYRVSLKRQISSKNDGTKSKMWKFHNDMNFLRPYMKKRRRLHTGHGDAEKGYSCEEGEEDDREDEEMSEESHILVSDHLLASCMEPLIDITEAKRDVQSDVNNGSVSTDTTQEGQTDVGSAEVAVENGLDQSDERISFPSQSEHRIPYPDQSESRIPFVSQSAKPIAFSDQSLFAAGFRTESRDGLKLFFDAMYLTVKKMPESSQRKIKRKLFEAVCEAEDYLDESGYFNDSGANSKKTKGLFSEFRSVDDVS